jgi:hypothetical protein
VISFAVDALWAGRTGFSIGVLFMGTGQTFRRSFAKFANVAEAAAFETLSNRRGEWFQLQPRPPYVYRFWKQLVADDDAGSLGINPFGVTVLLHTSFKSGYFCHSQLWVRVVEFFFNFFKGAVEGYTSNDAFSENFHPG